MVFFGKSSLSVGTDLDTEKWRFSEKTTEAFVSVMGFGNATLRTIPGEGTTGRVMVYDARQYTEHPCLNDPSLGTDPVAYVNFLILNISLSNGVFRYLSGHADPPGNGFVPTCDADDICTVDADMRCVGDIPGKKNCAKCYARNRADAVAAESMQVWVSYYGTDGGGKRLRSGASNPLNFRKYSMGGVYNDLVNSVQNMQFDRLPQEDGLNPTNGIIETMRKWFKNE
jgi:hypothetical protein